MNSVENLVEQRLDHALVDHHSLLVGLGSTMELDDVLKKQPTVRQETQTEGKGLVRLTSSLRQLDL